MKTVCPKCGKRTEEGAFCEKCGAALGAVAGGEAAKAPALQAEDGRETAEPTPLEEVTPPTCEPAEPVAESGMKGARPEKVPSSAEPLPGPSKNPPRKPGPAEGTPVLEMDRMCVQFEDLQGTLRFRLTPPAGGYDRVVLTLLQPVTGQRQTWGPRRFRECGELRVPLGRQPAGWPTWTVRLECAQGGGRRIWEGDVDLLVVRPREAQRTAENLKVEITNHITLGNASDAIVNQRALDGLERLAAAENPFDELRRVILEGGRSWAKVDLYETGGEAARPAGAETDRLVLSWTGWTLRVFSAEVLRFGRERPQPDGGGNDFTLRPGPGGAREPYGRMSRMHCFFRREADGTVELHDGTRSDSGLVASSSNGTWWNGTRVEREGMRLGTGATGWVSFGGTPERGAVSLRADAGGEWMLLRRTDSVKEAILWLWGGFDLRRVDAAFGETMLCRKDGGFVWRCSGRGGWLVPGGAVQPGEGPGMQIGKADGRM